MAQKRKKRGFALMDQETLRVVTSSGGKASHALGRAHTWSKAEARKAGRIGGKKLKGSKWDRRLK